MRETAIQRLLPWLLPLLLLASWGSVCGFGLVPDWLLPPPRRVLAVLACYVDIGGEAVWRGDFWPDAAASLGRVGCGYALAAIPAILLGLLAGRCAWVERLLSSGVNGIRAVPGISWLPLVILWCGIGFLTTVTLIALAAFFPVYFSAAAGAASVPPPCAAVRRGRRAHGITPRRAAASLSAGMRFSAPSENAGWRGAPPGRRAWRQNRPQAPKQKTAGSSLDLCAQVG